MHLNIVKIPITYPLINRDHLLSLGTRVKLNAGFIDSKKVI